MGTAYIVKLDSMGAKVMGFGTSGVYSLDYGPGVFVGYEAVALQPGGRVLAVGGGSGAVFVDGLTSAGALDPSWSDAGQYWYDGFGGGITNLTDVAVDGMGRTVLVGHGDDSGGNFSSEIWVTRLTN